MKIDEASLKNRGVLRCLVHGTPAIVQPATGIVIAICNGTQYNLRLTNAPASGAADCEKLTFSPAFGRLPNTN